MKVGMVQQKCTEDREANIKRSIEGIREAASKGAQLVVLQELHTGVYFCQTEDDKRFDQAESIPGPSTETFGAVARELGIVLVISLFEKRAPGIYHNTAVVLEKDGSIAGKYRKTHIPDDPAYYEKYYFTPGDLGLNPIETSVGKLGVLVCWDQWYPENARMMAMGGADILIYPTAIGTKPEEDPNEHERQREAWITVQRGHAVANGLPVISVNRTGFETDPHPGRDGLNFWGSSFVAGCQGEFLAQAPQDKETVLVVDLDLDRIDKVRRAWPFFRDRRIDIYEELLKRYRD
ncbi:MAG: carbon-nitrogen hydrolase [Candidatus Sumerlaeia bacterium]|nr:carbon-nitrogen hydrolase [Candidatus Sumerlaeia bacterium]